MNKRTLALFFVAIIIASSFSLAFASAFSFREFFDKITGKAAFPISKNNCTDSDGGLNYNVLGNLTTCNRFKCKAYTDSCTGNSKSIIERYCLKNNMATKVYKCSSGCKNGACVENTLDGCSLINQTIIDKIIELQKDSENHIILKEGEKINRSYYFIVPGRLMKVNTITNQTAGYSQDKVKFSDISAGYGDSALSYITDSREEGKAIVIIGEDIYNVSYYGDSTSMEDSRYVILDYPQTQSDAKMTFYCNNISGIKQ